MKKTILGVFAVLLAGPVLAQPPGGAGGAGLPDNETILANNDGNGDGQITLEEATAAGLQLGMNFATFDTDGDGIVTTAELDGVRAGMGGAPGAPAPAAPAPAPAEEEEEEEEEESED